MKPVPIFRLTARLLLALTLGLSALPAALAQCPASVPAEGASLPGPLPLFPADNWWNTDISAAPLDAASANYIAFINNGGTRHLHPDFGGEASPGSVAIYGMPYAVVDGTQAKQAVTFQYWDESDGVNLATGQGVPFYPIPAQAISQPHWIEGGAPGSVDQRSQDDRHLLIVDCSNQYLYELYNVFYDPIQAKWLAGSGAFFDMKTDNRRPDGWTSADAAGLAIFPGLVRYDDAWNPALTDIGHAFRVTVRATNGYVYPASHRAGSTAGALPMGARLRLKKSVGGLDPALRTSDPNAQKIFRAMQKYGLIVADNGSDMYITGTFDTRWNNNILNPAFSTLTASDFEVVQLGWKPSVSSPVLSALSANPNAVVGGNASTGTVTLAAAAPIGGASVLISSASSAVVVPASVSVPQGATSASFPIATSAVSTATLVTLSATYGGVTKTTTFSVNPPPPPALSAISANPNSVIGGNASTGTVTLAAGAPAGGATVLLSSASFGVGVPASVSIAQGGTSASFTITTVAVLTVTPATLSASYGGVTKTTTLTVNPPAAPPSALSAITTNPSSVVGSGGSTGTVTLTSAAPSGGATVLLSSASSAVVVPASVSIAQGTTSANFGITTSSVSSTTPVTLSASYAGMTRTATLTVNAPPAATLSSLTLYRSRVTGGTSDTGTVTLSVPPSSDAVVALASSNPALASVPASVIVKAGTASRTFTVTTSATRKNVAATLSASYAGITKTATLTVMAR